MTTHTAKEQSIPPAPMCLACASLFAYVDLSNLTAIITIDQCPVCHKPNYISSEWWPRSIPENQKSFFYTTLKRGQTIITFFLSLIVVFVNWRFSNEKTINQLATYSTLRDDGGATRS